MNAAGKTAMCLLGAGIVGGAVATPLVLTRADSGAIDIVKGEGIKNIIKTVDVDGNTNVEVEVEKEDEGVTKDSVEVYCGNEQLEEDEYEIEEDRRIIIPKHILEKYKRKLLKIIVKSILVSTPNKFIFDANRGVCNLKADIQGELCIPAQINGVKVTKVDTRQITQEQRALITKLTLSNNIKEFLVDEGEQATPPFAFFTNLTEVRMSDSMEKLPMGCFGMCSSLKHFKGGMRIKELHDGCFYGCEKLEKITLKQCKAIAGECFRENKMLKEAVFSDELTMFGENAFHNCYGLEKFALPPKVSKIGRDAFKNCLKLNKMLFPKSLGNQIDFGAFANNVSLKELFIESAYMAKCELDQDFHGAYHNAEKIFIKKGLEVGNAIARNFVKNARYVSNDYDLYEPNTANECLTYSYYENDQVGGYDKDKCAVRCPASNKTALTLTKEINKKRVKMMNSYGCANNRVLEEFNFPTDYEEGDLNRFDSIGSDFDHGYSFYMCDKLKAIKNIKHVKRICGHSFHGCSALEEFYMPDELEWIDNPEGGSGYFNIGPEAFAGCNAMKKLYFSLAQSQMDIRRPFDVTHNDWKIFKHGQKVHVKSGTTLDSNSFLALNSSKDTQLSNETYDVYTMNEDFEE